VNQLLAPNGPVDCSFGQHGKVWFLAGTFTTDAAPDRVPAFNANRSCTIPTGTMLFLPIVNSENDNVRLIPGPSGTNTEQQLRQLPAEQMDSVVGMQAFIDGRPVSGLSNTATTRYRVKSPLFQYSLPDEQHGGNISGPKVPSGPIPAPGAVADGAFLMLSPLGVGTHTLRWTGGIPKGATESIPDGFTQDITYTIKVAPPAR
jgi:hypothetical protein